VVVEKQYKYNGTIATDHCMKIFHRLQAEKKKQEEEEMAFEVAVRNPKDFSDKLLSLKTSKKLCDAELIVNGERYIFSIFNSCFMMDSDLNRLIF
jgi:hypothetical protein